MDINIYTIQQESWDIFVFCKEWEDFLNMYATQLGKITMLLTFNYMVTLQSFPNN